MALIDDLISAGYLKTPVIIEAFRRIKRRNFVLPQNSALAEVNSPLPIGYGQTISQPLTVAFMIELLAPQPGDKILDVGSGSGWTVALLAAIVGREGKVYGLEIIDELQKFAVLNVGKYNFIGQGMAAILHGDGYRGLPEMAPFDRIIVAAAARDVPEKLLAHLKIGGRLVIPLGETRAVQDIVALTKISADRYSEDRHPGFIFVPLVTK